MVYERTTWETGDIVTAVKLNKIEEALADIGNHFIVEFELTSGSGGTVDKTLAEVKEAFISGSRIILYGAYGAFIIAIPIQSYFFDANSENMVAYSGSAVYFDGDSYIRMIAYVDSTGISIGVG